MGTRLFRPLRSPQGPRLARLARLAAVESHPLVKPDPPPKVVVTELAESAVNLALRVWLADAHKEREA